MTARILPFPSLTDRSSDLVAALQTQGLLQTISASRVKEMGGESLLTDAFPLYSFSAEPQYFVGSLLAQLIGRDSLPTQNVVSEISLDELVIPQIGAIAIDKKLAQERLVYLQKNEIIEVHNKRIPIAALDFILEDFIAAVLGKPSEYQLQVDSKKVVPITPPIRKRTIFLQSHQYLSLEEQLELGRIIQTNGPDSEAGQEAVAQLVEGHERYMYKMIHKLGLDSDDPQWNEAVSRGGMGMVEAARRYDPTKRFKFMSYAVFWIKAEIFAGFMADEFMVKIGTNQAQRKLYYGLKKLYYGKIPELRRFSEDGEERQATPEEIAKHFNVSVGSVKNMQKRLAGGRDESLDQPPFSDNEKTKYDHIASNSPTPEQAITSNAPFAKEVIPKLLPVLDERELYIFQRRALREEPQTLEEIGKQLGITRERTRQLEARGMNKIREEFHRQYPDLERGDFNW